MEALAELLLACVPLASRTPMFWDAVLNIIGGKATAFTTVLGDSDVREPCTNPMQAMRIDAGLPIITATCSKIVLRDGDRVIKIAIMRAVNERGEPQLNDALHIMQINNAKADMHPEIVAYDRPIAVVQTSESIFVISTMPYAGAVADTSNFTSDQQRQLEIAIFNMHRHGAHHGDLVWENILVDDAGRVRMINPLVGARNAIEPIDLRCLIATPFMKSLCKHTKAGVFVRYQNHMRRHVNQDVFDQRFSEMIVYFWG